ncbi:hypothetical protein [Clostridium estertheticum]|nr:hypothetical protein [Clostridium estertheticum]
MRSNDEVSNFTINKVLEFDWHELIVKKIIMEEEIVGLIEFGDY